LFLVGGSLGAMTLPWLVGQLYEPYGGSAVIAVTAGAMVAAVLVLGLIARWRQGADASVAGSGVVSPA
jgi:uncharacterized membrane protein YccC